jgi:urocanate hydratase
MLLTSEMSEKTTSYSNKIEDFLNRYASHPNYKSPTGTTLNAKSWQTEAPLRMLLNNLDSEVAEDPDNLIVYGGIGQAARNKESLRGIIAYLLELEDDESLLVQSGKAIGVIRTHSEAPRVLIANSNLVPNWSSWKDFNKLRDKGLTMYGQMTAGSWIYIGSQGILQGTYETFASAAQRHFNGSLKGKIVVSGGLGGMGGAQPLSVTLNDGIFLGVDIDPKRIQKRLDTRYIDKMTDNYYEAVKWILEAKKQQLPLSVGLVGDIGTVLKSLINDNVPIDLATDQTSAHDPLNGYVPSGYSIEEALILREEDPKTYQEKSLLSMASHVSSLIELKNNGSIVFDYGNNLRAFAKEGGEERAFEIPGFVPEYIRPLFCEGKGPFRFAALSGDPEDIFRLDEALMELFPEDDRLIHWLKEARSKIAFQGLPSRICWLGLGAREKAGIKFNEMIKDGILKGPIVVGRDHLDTGSVASPNRETEGMKDGSDAISDWPLLNLMSNCSSGATWVSFHHGGGVGMGYSQHAGMVIMLDGTKRSHDCLKRVLHNDPATGVLRHADAGYETAQDLSDKFHLQKN